MQKEPKVPDGYDRFSFQTIYYANMDCDVYVAKEKLDYGFSDCRKIFT